MATIKGRSIRGMDRDLEITSTDDGEVAVTIRIKQKEYAVIVSAGELRDALKEMRSR